MTQRWTRTRDLVLPAATGDSSEIWELREAGRIVESFPMQVRLGKPFDVLRMKGQSSEQLRVWTAQVRAAIAALYAPGAPRRIVNACPCCGSASGEIAGRIHGVAYQRCKSCAHLFVREQPAPDVLNRMFAENADYAQDYASKQSLEQRLREIVAPKLEWLRATYRAQHRRELSSVLDVGAGGGHFVACARKAGLAAEGYEINEAAAGFAKSALAVDLKRDDFLTATAYPGRHDVISFWGLLEYTPEPVRFVAAARRWLNTDGGMLVLEVPRADAFGSAVQMQFPNSVWRHLAPASHVNVFSDASVATLLHDNGFRPVAAWYFGMDFYELLCQLAATRNDDRILSELGALVAPMQAALDSAEFVDDLIIAAVPA